jgi:flagellar export protein FliJ
MTTFRFRAAPLLALRQRQFDAAQERLARANEDLATADRLFAAAERGVEDACNAHRDALAHGADNATLQRHRNWIAQRYSLVDMRRRAQAECGGVVVVAKNAVMVAHRQVRVLERLRDRARKRHEALVRVHELKEIDLLATLQYARRMADGGQL